MTEAVGITAEAEANSRDPHDWGRAMALAVTRLAEQLASEGSDDIHATLVDRDLCLTIRDDPEGVLISLSTEFPERGQKQHRKHQTDPEPDATAADD
jgi:hypothetical protein